MLRTCDGTDPNLIRYDEDGVRTVCACGLTFDDVRCFVIFPHRRFTDAKAHAQRIIAMVADGTMTEAEALAALREQQV